MDSFITDLSAQGDHDSRGAFTLDVASAQLKLAEYQLSSFYDFPKFVLSAAVTGGAERLVIWRESKRGFARKQRTLFRFENWVLTPRDFHSLGFQSLDQNIPKAIRYLAMALSTLGSRHKSIINSGRDQCQICLLIENQQISRRETERAYFIPNSTVLEVRSDLLDEVRSKLAQLSRWSPLPIEIEGKLLPRGLNTANDLPHAIGLYGNPGVVKVELSESHKAHTLVDREAEFPQLLAFTSLTEASKVGFHAIVDGLPYSLRGHFNFPAICGFVVANHLQRDLSYNKLVQNQELENMIAHLRNSVAQLMETTLRAKPKLDPNKELTIHRILSRLSETLEISHISALLNQNSDEMQPCSFESDLKILKMRLQSSTAEEQERLFQAYRARIYQLWKERDIDLALHYLNSELACRKSVGNHDPDRDKTRLLLRMIKLKPEEDFQQTEGLGLYLTTMRDWSQAQIDMVDPHAYPGVHPSWFLPVLLNDAEQNDDWTLLESCFPQGLPQGVRFWKLILHGNITEAQSFVKTAPDLDYKGNRRLWYAFFWVHCKGMLDWAALIRLRMKLSRACVIDGLDEQGETWNRLLEAIGVHPTSLAPAQFRREAFEMVRKGFGKPEFWPKFLSLFCYGRTYLAKTEVRGLWASALAMHILQRAATTPTETLLSEPLSFGVPLSPSP